MNITPALQTAISTRNLTRLTLWKTPKGWQANAQFNADGAWRCCTEDNAMEAILKALGVQDRSDFGGLLE